MSTITRLKTFGSVGFNTVEANSEWGSDSTRIEMFKVKDLYPTFLKANSPVRGFVLPGFDPSLDLSDAARPMSFGPYRDINLVDHKTNMPSFTDWVYFVSGYTFYGNSNSSFLSPSNVGMVDPIVELRKHVYRLKYNNPQEFKKYEFLLAPGTKKEDKKALPNISTLALMNVWCANPNDKAKDAGVVTNRVLVLKNTAFEKLSSDLNEYQPSGLKEPRDHAWPMFLRGDITNPAQALEWHISTHVGSNGFQTNVLDFGSVAMVPGGQMVFNCRAAQIPAEALRGRYDLGDLENVVHVPTTEEVINLLVDDALIPYELICDVCGRFVDSMPTKKAKATTYSTPSAAPVQPAQPSYPSYAQAAPMPAASSYAPPAQPYAQPAQAYVPSAPMPAAQPSQPARLNSAVPAAPVNRLLQEDPNDDIPYDTPAPAAAPAAAAPAAPAAQPSGSLTPDEAARLATLSEALRTGANLSVDDFKELQTLVGKSRS